MDVMNPIIGTGTDAEVALLTNSADSAHSVEQVEKLISKLEDLDVTLSIEDGKIAYDAPEGVLKGELLQLLEAARSMIRDALLKRDTVGEDHVDGCPTPPDAFLCRSCGAELPDDLERDSRCDRCNQVKPQIESWRDLASSQEDSADEQDVPGCETCGRYCDVQRLDGVWKCSRCDPEAAARRDRTERIVRLQVAIIADQQRRAKVRLRFTRLAGQTTYRDLYDRDLRKVGTGLNSKGVIDVTPGPPCSNCRSTRVYAVLVHDGKSVRTDCSGCGDFIENPIWYDKAAIDAWLAEHAQKLGFSKR